MKRWLLVALMVMAAGSARAEDEGDEEAMAVAHRYGMDRFEQLDALKFTFNVRRGTVTISRSWTWEIGAGQVSLSTREGKQRTEHTYRLADVSKGDGRTRKADQMFVNDRYWLIFPYHLVNDRSVEFSIDQNEPFPIPPGAGDRLTVAYSDNVGYTPGDVYEVFLNEDHLIRQWIFRKGGAARPTLVATWEDQARLGPIVVPRRFRNADGSLEIWFSDVEARLRGKSDWVKPEAL